jgi:Acyl-CoA dehydrogenases
LPAMNSALPTATPASTPAQDLRRAMHEALQTAPPTSSPDGAGGFPRAWWAHLGRRGVLGLGFLLDGRPPAADAVQVSALAGQITHATGSLGLGMAWMMQQMLGRYVLGPLLQQGASDASQALLAQLLAAMAAGECLLALAISEPGVGAQPKHLRTRAVPQPRPAGDGDWVLDGHKAFISNGPAADAIIVLAVSAEHEGRKRFDAFLLDAQTPGLTREANARVQGLAPLGHCDLLLESCRVPAIRRIGPPGLAFETIARPVRAVEERCCSARCSAPCSASSKRSRVRSAWQHRAVPAPQQTMPCANSVRCSSNGRRCTPCATPSPASSKCKAATTRWPLPP